VSILPCQCYTKTDSKKHQKYQNINGLKATIPVFYVKSVLIRPKIDTSMILEQDWMEKILDLGILDGREMKVDDEIVSRGSSWLFHLMKQRLNT